MSRVCGEYWEEQECVHGFGEKFRKIKRLVRKPRQCRWITLKCIVEKWYAVVMAWILQAQHKSLVALMHMVMNLWVP
jgi:hypothetical protein